MLEKRNVLAILQFLMLNVGVVYACIANRLQLKARTLLHGF